jgi:hypothetical protein
MPKYFRETLPSRKNDPAWSLVSGIPDSVDRPSAEVLDKLVIDLYKDIAIKKMKNKMKKL